MPRVKRGTTHVKKRRSLLKLTKGFNWGRKNLIKLATTAANKAGHYAYRDRRNKKRDFRRLWLVKISAGARALGTTYGQLIASLKKSKIDLNRKILSELADKNPEVFAKVVEAAKR